MNLARLNHILIPATKDGRDAQRNRFVAAKDGPGAFRQNQCTELCMVNIDETCRDKLAGDRLPGFLRQVLANAEDRQIVVPEPGNIFVGFSK